MLPYVKIQFANGALGQVSASADGVLGFVLSGVAVPSTFALSTAYVLRSPNSLKDLGVTVANNAHIYNTLKDYYAEAGEGTEIWIMAFPASVPVADLVDPTEEYATKLIKAANGRLRGLIVSRKPDGSYTPTIQTGIDKDIVDALLPAQQLGSWAALTRFAPLFTILEAYAFNGNVVDLLDLKTLSHNAVGVFVGNTVSGTPNTSIGLLAGRIAKNPVQRNIGRVIDGPIATNTAFIKDKAIELTDIESIHNKGYITLRTFVGRAGYFFADDFLATADTDDYCHLTARRTVDKAYRIAYNKMLDMLLQEFEVNADGTVQEGMAVAWEAEVENAIALQMTSNGELSSIGGDSGVVCSINRNINLVSTGKMLITLRVRPFGYARYVDVSLGLMAVAVS